MPRVLLSSRLPDGSLDPLVSAGVEVVGAVGPVERLTHAQLHEQVTGADALVAVLDDAIDRDLLNKASRLRVVANVAVGYDNIDVPFATSRGIVVTNTPGILHETTADIAFYLMLAASRLTTTAERELRSGLWNGWNVNDYLGNDVQGRTLGVVGWGQIGSAVARRATGFDMRVIHHSRSDTSEPGYVADLDELLAEADIVSLHVPLTEATRHLIDARRLDLMKRSAVLVNTARGAVVDETALATALHNRGIFAAGLDVFEDEPAVHPDLLTAPNAVLLPHIGSATTQTRLAMGRLATSAVVQVLEGQTPANTVPPQRAIAGAGDAKKRA